jgi:hypothetical protein
MITYISVDYAFRNDLFVLCELVVFYLGQHKTPFCLCSINGVTDPNGLNPGAYTYWSHEFLNFFELALIRINIEEAFITWDCFFFFLLLKTNIFPSSPNWRYYNKMLTLLTGGESMSSTENIYNLFHILHPFWIHHTKTWIFLSKQYAHLQKAAPWGSGLEYVLHTPLCVVSGDW